MPSHPSRNLVALCAFARHHLEGNRLEQFEPDHQWRCLRAKLKELESISSQLVVRPTPNPIHDSLHIDVLYQVAMFNVQLQQKMGIICIDIAFVSTVFRGENRFESPKIGQESSISPKNG